MSCGRSWLPFLAAVGLLGACTISPGDSSGGALTTSQPAASVNQDGGNGPGGSTTTAPTSITGGSSGGVSSGSDGGMGSGSTDGGTSSGADAGTGATAGATDGGTDAGTSGTGGGTATAELNVLPVTVNGLRCSAGSYLNKPCVSVTVCTPGTSSCQTIDDVLLDTGSYGLRIFKQALTITTPTVSAGAGTLAECVQYAGGVSDWGPVATADVVLAGEPAIASAHIQVVDSTFGVVPAACPSVETSPSVAGMNGVLGVGAFTVDCGQYCASYPQNGLYYSCTSSGCTGYAASTSKQVQNPVALLPVDNNGIVVQLPSVPVSGTTSVDGVVLLGIGTRSNNVPSGPLTRYALDQYGELVTTFAGTSYRSFVDTGSNGLFFGPPSTVSLPNCQAPDSEWFCPSTLLSFQAQDQDGLTPPVASGTVSFQIGSFLQYFGSSGAVFPAIGGPVPVSSGFDWGLPFFFGKPVYVGYEGRSSTLGTGMYCAF